MITNKVIAEKINVFLNLLFHFEDYINNQKIREEQLHISDNVKNVLSEVSYSEKVKDYFFHGADANHNHDENEIDSIFKPMTLTEDKINYIKKANPQGFNQKNLELLNFFYNSTGEIDMINDLIKSKILSIIKYGLTQVMLKKLKEKEKKIYSKINFVLINKNNNKLLNNFNNKFLQNQSIKFSIFKNKRSLSELKEQFRLKPNFIVPPINNGKANKNNIKNKRNNIFANNEILKKGENNNITKVEDYNTNLHKNYILIQDDLRNKDKNNDQTFPDIISKNYGAKYLNKNPISPSIQLDLIHLLHKRKKKKSKDNKFSQTSKKLMNENNNINIVNEYENDKIKENKVCIRSQSNPKINIRKSDNVNRNKRINSNHFNDDKNYSLIDILKKRGYMC